MSSIFDWSLTAATNATADSSINWQEGQLPSTVNNSARQMMARVAELLKDVGLNITAGGTANALTITTNSPFTTYATGQIAVFKAASTNTGATTINANSIGAKSVRKDGDAALSGGELSAGHYYAVIYSTALNGGSGGWLLVNPTNTEGLGQCRLTLSGGNLLLSRFNGSRLTINGIGENIPSAGITLAATGLTPSTLYYIYAYMNSGTMALEASTTVPVADTATGIQIKTGDATRSLVGMARPVTGPAWADTTAQRFVLSYYNRVRKRAEGSFTASRSTTSTTFVEINTEIRFEFLAWGDTDLSFGANGTAYTNPGAGTIYTRIALDGTTNWVAQQGQATATDYLIPVTATGSATPTVGYHYATLIGRVTSGTANWVGTPQEAKNLIYGLIEG